MITDRIWWVGEIVIKKELKSRIYQIKKQNCTKVSQIMYEVV